MRGHCGLDCELCDAYIATKQQDPLLLANVAREWSMFGERYTAEDIECDGCTTEGGRLFAWCGHCPVRQCCSSRHLVHCGTCEDFPCQIIDRYPDSGIVARLNALRNT